jgi:hypothetical protein
MDRFKFMFLFLAVSAFASFDVAAVAQINLPNAVEKCPKTEGQKMDFTTWWENARATGSVDPPNNLTFTSTDNCDFYMFAERMFLWLTSPAPRHDLHVFEMPIFYQVSPPDSQHNRQLLINTADLNKPNPNKPDDLTKLKKASVSITQFDNEGNAAVLDRDGKVYSFVHQETSENGAPIIRNRDDGLQSEIERTQVAQDGGPVFLDKFGKPIPFKGRPDGLLRDFTGKTIDFDPSFKKFFRNGQPFFLDRSGGVIETERGAASQPVLMAQARRKLVYYTIEVNDVYAYFLTGTKTVLPGSATAAITETHFPITLPELSAVETFAGTKFPDRQVLTVEIKFAWIEAVGLRNQGDYITTWANIPKYYEKNPEHWVKEGWKPAKLALVGMHIAFSAKGHGEMVWTTFEHVNNAVNPAYCYNDDHSGETTNPPSNKGVWLFSSRNNAGRSRRVNCKEANNNNVNIQHMYVSGDDIRALPGHRIEPSNVLRINPWGFRPSEVENNTEIISLNRSVLRELPRGDVRRNYVNIGATWRFRGNASQEGAWELANTTMETFFQRMGDVNQMTGCLGCHQGSAANMLGSRNGGVSHIYCATSPLPIAASSPVPRPGCSGQ